MLLTTRAGRTAQLAALTVVATAASLLVHPPADASSRGSGAPPVAAAAAPGVPTGLPAGIEGLARYVPATSCEPHAKPGTTALGNLLAATYPGTRYGIDRTCGTDPLPTSEHYDGRALDFFLHLRDPRQRAQAGALLAWLFAADSAGRRSANARRLGVMYVIWNNRIWGSYRASEGWRPYAGCSARPARAYDTTCHRDHIHFSLSWEGAMRRTSYWSRRVAAPDYGTCRPADLNWAPAYTRARATPCPSFPRVSAPARASALLRTLTTYSGMVLRRGDSGPVVRAVQQAVGTTGDGLFGQHTQAAVRRWQTARSLPATGVVSADTWRALLVRNAAPAPTTGRTHPELTRYAGLTLRMGSHGRAVTALQHRLYYRHAGGRFGAGTSARVRVFQRRHHLPATGVVAARTWRALGA